MTTTKTALTKLLRQKTISKATLHLIATEVGRAARKGEAPSSDAPPAEIAAFLVAHPVAARRTLLGLQGRTKDGRLDPFLSALAEIRGVGHAEIGVYTLMPTGDAVTVQHPKGTWTVERSTDPRVGLILMEQPTDKSATQLSAVKLPKAVHEHLALMFKL